LIDAARERFADPAADPRRRFKRLRLRAEALQREEAAWALAAAVESLFAAAEVLIPEAGSSAAAAEALDQIHIAISELLDGLE
jgi:hypothetical protein